MYSIDFAEHIWACSIVPSYDMTPVLEAVCAKWEAAQDAFAEWYIHDDYDAADHFTVVVDDDDYDWTQYEFAF